MNKFILQAFLVATIIGLISSCQYKWIVEPELPPPDPTDTVSFSQQIAPIFDDRNCTGCHNTGGESPDLTAANAYDEIISDGLVDTNDPESSLIYTIPNPNGNHFAQYTSSQAALLLLWIEQGALNN